jgi:hypothetical protein
MLDAHAKKRESKDVNKIIKNGKLTSSPLKSGSSLRKIVLSNSSANARDFAVAMQKWRSTDILAVAMDENGQVPIIAYYDLSNSKDVS